MKEPISNLGVICKDCGEERRKQWQENNENTIIKKGDCVKVEFKKNKISERMWMIVEKVNANLITGKLVNVPVLLKNIKYGDYTTIQRKDIENLVE